MIFNYLGSWYLPLCQHNLSIVIANQQREVCLTSIYSQEEFRWTVTHSLSSLTTLLSPWNLPFSLSQNWVWKLMLVPTVALNREIWFFGALNYSSTSLFRIKVFRILFLFFVIFLLSPNLTENLLTGKARPVTSHPCFTRSEEHRCCLNST